MLMVAFVVAIGLCTGDSASVNARFVPTIFVYLRIDIFSFLLFETKIQRMPEEMEERERKREKGTGGRKYVWVDYFLLIFFLVEKFIK